ncbi:MAG: PfkB family carbohydrate kinase [Woeseiaceae bacterium]|nr:PfkB family carbohydrate kinase [Woeseiaceae bacterium]
MASQRERQILDLILDDPMISQQSIADRLEISRSAVAGHIMRLTNRGVIKGRAYVVEREPFIAVVGGVNVDVHGRPARSLKLHDSNPGTVTTSAGGVARNVAENLARLGADVRLISAVGDDHHGRLLLEHGRATGIDMQHVLISASNPTSTYMSIVDRRGDMHVAINDMAVMDELNASALQNHESILRQAVLVIADTNLPDDALAWLCESIDDTPLFVDTVSTVKARRIEPHLDTVHTLKCNQAEAEALSGYTTRTKFDRTELADWFHARGVERLFVTLGNRGVFYSTPGDAGIEKPHQTVARNTGGAGDAFLAGVALAWIEDRPLKSAIRFALAAAELTVAEDSASSGRITRAAVERAMV